MHDANQRLYRSGPPVDRARAETVKLTPLTDDQVRNRQEDHEAPYSTRFLLAIALAIAAGICVAMIVL